MDPKARAAITFVCTTAGAAFLEKAASRQAAKLGIPHVVAGLIAAAIAHEI
jgi:hypothetical protein